MNEDREATKIVKRARELLRGTVGTGLTVCKSSRIEQPIPVLKPGGELHSWFVAVTVGELLAGFFEFQPDLTLLRYSSFQRQEDTLEGCPRAELWLDVNTIQRRVEGLAKPEERIRKSFLSYDKVPSRLAWASVLESADGTIRIAFVAGEAAWLAPFTPSTPGTIGTR